MIRRPEPNEYNPYFSNYIGLVPEGDVVSHMERQLDRTAALIRSIPAEKATFRYAPGKWSVAETFGHIADTERVMSYRLLRIARGDRTPLPPFEQDDFVRGARFDEWTLEALAADYEAVRRSTLSLLRNLPEEAFDRIGIVSGKENTAAAIAYVIAGHELHHVNIVQERYL